MEGGVRRAKVLPREDGLLGGELAREDLVGEEGARRPKVRRKVRRKLALAQAEAQAEAAISA